MIDPAELSELLSALGFCGADSESQSLKMPRIRSFQMNDAYPQDKILGEMLANDGLNLHQCRQYFFA